MNIPATVSNPGDFALQIDRWTDGVKKAAAEAARGLAHEAFERLLRNSPQYSGDFAAGWGVGYGALVSNFREGVFPGHEYGGDLDPFGRADLPAMEHARANVVWQTPKLGTPIFIANDARHEHNYALLIENDQINWRTPNMGSGHLVTKVVKSMSRTYSHITKSQLETLRKAGV